MKYIFSNILNAQCYSEREKQKIALTSTLIFLVFKIFNKINLISVKSGYLNIFRFINHKCALLLRRSNFHRKAFKMQSLNSVTLHVSPKKNYFRGAIEEEEINLTSKFSPSKFFLSELVLKLVNIFVSKGFQD